MNVVHCELLSITIFSDRIKSDNIIIINQFYTRLDSRN